MTLKQFAAKRNLRISHPPVDDYVIQGKYGHLFEYDDAQFGVLIMPPGSGSRRWALASKQFRAANMVITQDADGEGVAAFDPNNREQLRLALRHAGISRKRKATPAQLQALAASRRNRMIEDVTTVAA
jgi:hypothetical protein